jgi:selT/selW/selH-like putative selenoprotein
LTEKLLVAGKQRIKSLELVPFSDGRFEVFRNEKKVHSKLETGEFPKEDVIVKKVLAG